jgi:hypothetical protein
MDEQVLLPSVGLAAVLILVYVVRCYRSDLQYDQSILIDIVLNASGIVCGGFLIGASCFPQIMARISGINLYVLIGGLAVLAVSFQGLYRDVFAGLGSRAPDARRSEEAAAVSLLANRKTDDNSDVA